MYKLRPSIVVLGLENAGKSSIVSMLKNNSIPMNTALPPTETMCNKETIKLNNQKMTVYDIGGSFMHRQLWPSYASSAAVLVYVIDSTDLPHISEATLELHKLYKNGASDSILPFPGINNIRRSTPLIILCNKCDIPGAIPADKIKKILDLDQLPVNNAVLIPCSAKTGLNLQAALYWITKQLSK